MPSKVGGAATGALSGAATGAAIGSVVPGIGTAIGAVGGGIIGGIGGWFSGSDDENKKPVLPNYDMATSRLGSIADTAQGREAPYVNPAWLDRTYLDQSRGGMVGVANRLGAIAGGQQAGAGELAVNRQVGQGLAAQIAAARMARGANAALAYRNMARNSADMRLAGAGMAAQAQMADQAAANQQLGGLYGQMYGMDTTVADRNAQLAQQANLANQSAILGQRQMNDAREMAALGQLLGWDQASNGANLNWAQYQSQQPNYGAMALTAAGQLAQAYANEQRNQPPPTTTPAQAEGPVTSPSTFGQYQRATF